MPEMVSIKLTEPLITSGQFPLYKNRYVYNLIFFINIYISFKQVSLWGLVSSATNVDSGKQVLMIRTVRMKT